MRITTTVLEAETTPTPVLRKVFRVAQWLPQVLRQGRSR